MFRVTCAVIRNDQGKVLVVQRGPGSDHPGKWEFPGGKVESGETDEDCVIREVLEEVGLEIVICSELPVVEHDYGFKQITLVPFICDSIDEIPALSEHQEYRWLDVSDLRTLDFCGADIPVALSYIERIAPDISAKDISGGDQEEFSDINIEQEGCLPDIGGEMETEWLADSDLSDPDTIKRLVSCMFSGDKRLAFHASWTFGKAFDNDHSVVYPYLDYFIGKLEKTDNESVLRVLLKSFSISDIDRIDANLHGFLADYCFQSLRSGKSAIAIKVYSMETIYNLSGLYPELRNELEVSIYIVMNGGSPAIVSRGRTILNKMGKL